VTDIVPLDDDERDAQIAAQPYNEDTAKHRTALRSTTVGEAAAVMLVSGSTPQEIADILELDGPEHAKRLAIRTLATQFDEHDKDSLKRMVLGMYRQLYSSALRRSENPRYNSREAAAANAMKSVTEMVKVLGIAEPKKVEIYTPTTTEIESMLRDVAGLVSKALPQEADVIDGVVLRDEPA
jgi:hypothetical protein